MGMYLKFHMPDRIVQEFGDAKAASSGALQEERGDFVPLGKENIYFFIILHFVNLGQQEFRF